MHTLITRITLQPHIPRKILRVLSVVLNLLRHFILFIIEIKLDAAIKRAIAKIAVHKSDAWSLPFSRGCGDV